MTYNNQKCLGCITHDEKYNLDWNSRYILLKDEVKNAKIKVKHMIVLFL